jgi:serine/threonine-protein kinase
MELMDGQSMQDWVEQLGKLSVADALLVTITCAEALAHAHGKNMIHRDIKPDNILVTKKGVIKVSDMGLAKVIDDEDMSMTQSGTGLGTPHYMPPEQARNAKHVDHRCDIYALAVTLYHFVTGQVPFEGGTVVDLITNKEKGFYKPAKQVNPSVPERLDLMIGKAMAKDAQHRYQSCEEFIRDLESLNLAGESLSFIDAPDKVVVRRSASPSAVTQAGMRTGRQTIAAPAPTKPQSRSGERPAAAIWEDETWYVRHRDPQGNAKVSKLKADLVMRLVKTDQLDETAAASMEPKGPFLPLAQIGVFEDEARKMLTRQSVKKREKSLAATYAKLDKQHSRQKWWRLFKRFREGTLGMASLVIWLALIAGVIFAGVKWGPDLWRSAAEKMGIANPAEEDDAADTPADAEPASTPGG